MEEQTHTDSDLETISKSGKAPKSRLTKSESAWNILHKLIDRDESRSRKRALIQGQIDGNRPYDPSELKRLGQSHRSNVNFRDAEGMRDSRKTSYYELLMEVETLVKIDTPEYFSKEDPNAKWGDVIAEKFTDMLTSWSGWWFHMMLHQEQMVTWGIGNMYWENELDWKFKSARVGTFLVPDETKASLDEFDLVAIRDSYLVHELFEYIQDKEASERSRENGWNTKLVKQLIMTATEGGSVNDNHSLGEWESLQQKIKDNDLEYSYGDFSKIPISHMLVREYDGKISHFIISENKNLNITDTNGGEPANFLYKNIGQFENWHEAVCLFLANVGEGTYHSIRGLGAKIYAHCQINDRLKNVTVDGAMSSATILLKPSNDSQKERIRIVRVGPFSVMPSGYDIVQQGSFQSNLQGLIGVDSLLQANLNKNIGMYRPDVVDEEKTPQGKNSMELRNRASKEAKLEKSDINIYYVQWDRLYREVLRRALNKNLTSVDPGWEEVKKFRDACKAAGVPQELMNYDKLMCSARRAIGYGSPVMRSLITADILSVSPYFDESGKDNAVRDYVQARAGTAGVNRYMPPIDRNQIPTTQHTLANLENNDMREGAQVVVGIDQPHVIHLIVHVRDLAQDADAFIQGQYQGEPMQLYTFLNTGIQHCAKHLDYMVGDPARENEYQAFSAQLEELAKVNSHVESIVRRQQEEQQAQAQKQMEALQKAQQEAEQSKQQVAMVEAQGDIALRAMKEEGIQKVREAKALHGMQIEELLAKHKVDLENRTQ